MREIPTISKIVYDVLHQAGKITSIHLLEKSKEEIFEKVCSPIINSHPDIIMTTDFCINRPGMVAFVMTGVSGET